MGIKSAIACLAFLCAGLASDAQRSVALASPDGRIRYTFSTTGGQAAFRVAFAGKPVVESSDLGFSFGSGVFGPGARVLGVARASGVERYRLVAGKTGAVEDPWQEAVIALSAPGTAQRLSLHVRLFNGAVAFRYEFPEAPDSLTIRAERTSFRFAGDPRARVAILENFTTSHEHLYRVGPLSAVPADSLLDLPAFFECPNGLYAAITEADLRDYAGMSLVREGNRLVSRLTPRPDSPGVCAKLALPHATPWRVLLLSDRPGALIESNVLTDLCPDTKATDLTWLRPGHAAFHWWNGDIMPDTTFEPGVNFDFNKYYIDFCARNHIAFHTVIGYRGVAWYQNDGIGYMPGPHTNVTVPRPGLELERICAYAKSKGVGIRFWVHWAALYPKLDSAFALFEKWGIKGMMCDFMDRDDQLMVRIQEEILQKALQHHLEIQFHGAYKPTGLSRMYPNESTREGTLNYENDKWGRLITPDDDIQIPFTRGLAGCTDYHLGGFRAMKADAFKHQFTRPHVLATRAHMLAMYVVLENHLSMLCDYPEAYEGQDGFEELKAVPTVWDETKAPFAEPGRAAAIARRKGNDWWIGVIGNGQPQTFSFPLTFLGAGRYEMLSLGDPPGDGDPNRLLRNTRTVTARDSVEAALPPGGGLLIRLSPTPR